LLSRERGGYKIAAKLQQNKIYYTGEEMRGGARPNAGRKKGSNQYGEPTKPVRLPMSLIPSVMRFVREKGYQLPLYGNAVSAGFPSPTDDFIETTLDLNEHLIPHPSSTFFVRAIGDSMIDVGIFSGDILVVDRSISPDDGHIVIAAIDGELTVKRLYRKNGECALLAENPDYPKIPINDSQSLMIWGVVIHSIRQY
jgi:DNA polymerase V